MASTAFSFVCRLWRRCAMLLPKWKPLTNAVPPSNNTAVVLRLLLCLTYLSWWAVLESFLPSELLMVPSGNRSVPRLWPTRGKPPCFGVYLPQNCGSILINRWIVLNGRRYVANCVTLLLWLPRRALANVYLVFYMASDDDAQSTNPMTW